MLTEHTDLSHECIDFRLLRCAFVDFTNTVKCRLPTREAVELLARGWKPVRQQLALLNFKLRYKPSYRIKRPPVCQSQFEKSPIRACRFFVITGDYRLATETLNS